MKKQENKDSWPYTFIDKIGFGIFSIIFIIGFCSIIYLAFTLGNNIYDKYLSIKEVYNNIENVIDYSDSNFNNINREIYDIKMRLYKLDKQATTTFYIGSGYNYPKYYTDGDIKL